MNEQQARDLKKKSWEELHQLYRKGKLPALSSLSGDCQGEVVALSTDTLIGKLFLPVRLLDTLQILPWRGKTFESKGKQIQGSNRLFTDHFRLFSFKVERDSSLFDQKPCLLLDYAAMPNPFFIRAVRDEVREISPGVLLGQMYYGLSSSPSLVLYFALIQ